MTNLYDYLKDGACMQARAVMCMLQFEDICESYDSEKKMVIAQPQIARWENCREQGYVVSLINKKGQQLNIAFFEHRNSDAIHAVKWEQVTMNSPTIDTAIFGDIYKDKYDTSFSVGYGEICEMADWIKEELKQFWNKTTNNKQNNENNY